MVMVFTTSDETNRQDAPELVSSSPTTADASALAPNARRCLATGAVKPKTELIRFVTGPDNIIVPDLAARLPGRGLWVSADVDALKLAVRKNLFSRAAKTAVKADPALPQQVEQLLAKRCLELLGLARGAGLAVVGHMQVEEAVKARALAFVLVAADAGQDGVKKLYHATLIKGGFSRAQLGAALGREQLVYIGLKPHSLTEKLRAELARWQGVRTCAESSPIEPMNSERL